MRRIRRKTPLDYLLPFLILVGIGVIGILAFQLWSNFQKQNKADVYFYIVEGKAQVLPYGQQSWDRAFSGTKFLLGDSLKTSSAGKAVLEFFNGTLIRLGNDTSTTLKDLMKQPEKESILMYLDSGHVWVNAHKSEGVKEAFYEVDTAHLAVKAKGTVFAVESKDAEIVRVLDGEVTVDVKVTVDGKERIANTVNVGVGQEIVLDAAAIKAFESNQNPSILQALGEDFKQSDWYQWNINEDRSPSEFSSSSQNNDTVDSQQQVVTQQTLQSTQQSSQTSQEITNTQQTQATVSSDMLSVSKPLSGAETIQDDHYTISGTAVAETSKIVVNQQIGSTTNSYTLQKFKAGDKTWVYNVSVANGNLAAGTNTYTFYAYDSSGKKSEPLEITLVYQKNTVTINDTLTAPVVKTFNGGASSTVETGVVQVSGTIKGAEKVVVNGYTLGKFKAGDTTWSYFANETAGNLKPGVNTYQVYGIDEEGNKSSVVQFTITYNKPANSPQPQPTPPPTSTLQTQQTQYHGL